MTAQALAAYLDGLVRTAREASVVEDMFRSERVSRVLALEHVLALAFRRLNLMRAIAAAVTGAKDEAEAAEKGSAAFLRELDWTGATEVQRQCAERFKPVALAVWAAAQAEDEKADTDSVAKELASFEQWFAESRNVPFLSALEREVVELPLVEVS